MLGKVNSCAVLGLNGYMVQVEVDISPGLPRFYVVGLPDEAVWVVFEDVTAEDWFVGQKTVASIRSSGKL
jgi:magnesium chelatase family protein